MPDPAEHSRRDRILDAAENAFAEHGFAGASLRTIVCAAKVNLATVYYYFSSKDGLMEAVLKRRFGMLREEQLSLLQAFQRQRPGKPLPVETILEALLRPALRLVAPPPHQSRMVARLIGRIATEPDAQTQAFLRSQHAPVRQAFLNALQLSLPHLTQTELRWRLEFISGALAFVLCNPRKLEQETRGACNPVDARRVLTEMTAFFSSGFHTSGNLGTRDGPTPGHRRRRFRGGKREPDEVSTQAAPASRY